VNERGVQDNPAAPSLVQLAAFVECSSLKANDREEVVRAREKKFRANTLNRVEKFFAANRKAARQQGDLSFKGE